MERILASVMNLPFNHHLLTSFFIRMCLIVYSDYHDNNFNLLYTDIDYKVFTDAARHVWKGNSPYKRPTYRYSPIIAYLLIPNVILSKHFGKVLFSVFDILIGIAVKVLVEQQFGKNKKNRRKVANYCSYFWLYNPLSIAISTRGNADSVACFFIIMSIFFLQTEKLRGLYKFALSGILLGISIHLRLYPLVFSFPMFLSLGHYKIGRRTHLIDGLISLIPNKKQIILAFSCVVTLLMLTFGMYFVYGYEFLFETYIYHLFRKDTKHNFSALFYYQYLSMGQRVFNVVQLLSMIFECVILFVLSLAFGSDPKTMPFALFCQAVVLVAFNTVITSQYFIWFLSLLPLVVHSFKMDRKNAYFLTSSWLSAQGACLYFAFLLEFQSQDVFLSIWIMGILFFITQLLVLTQCINCYSPGHGFGQIEASNKIKNK